MYVYDSTFNTNVLVGIPLVKTTFTVDPAVSFKKYFHEKTKLFNADWPSKIHQIYFSMETENFKLHAMTSPGRHSTKWEIKIDILTGCMLYYRYAIQYTKGSTALELTIDETVSNRFDNRGYSVNFIEKA